MRILYITFFLVLSVTLHAQNITSLRYGTTLAVYEVDIEFVEVIEDSRCPMNVNCVQAGKAIVLVNVFIEGNFLEERLLEFYPSGFNTESNITLFNADGLHIKGLNLMPYPVALSNTPKEDYYLDLVITN